jgi:hypothetical protein
LIKEVKENRMRVIIFFRMLLKIKNSYLVALLSITLTSSGRSEEAHFFADLLTAFQSEDGRIANADDSVIYDNSREIETTALAVIVWLNYSNYWEAIEKGITFLYSVCKNGRFGTAQATVLALKAIVLYDRHK